MHSINFIIRILLLSSISVAMLYSVAHGSWEPWALKQLSSIAFFFIMMILVSVTPPQLIFKSSYIMYFTGLILLLISWIFGHKAMGAQRWVRIGAINFQPSEFMKIGLILALARYYYTMPLSNIKLWKNLFIPLLLIAIPSFIVLKQPNLGTASIMVFISLSILFAAGVRGVKFIMGIAGFIISIPIVWYLMHPYQKKRVLTFLNPESDPLGSGYNIIQSLIAIGSGGYFGKGFIEGSQGQLDFLPEKQTDFILSILAEEFGFVGVVFTLLLSLSLVYTCYRNAFNASNQYFRLICIGIATSFALSIVINAGMISGVFPVVGTPYPLLSFGRSNLAVTLVGFGLIMNTRLQHLKKV